MELQELFEIELNELLLRFKFIQKFKDELHRLILKKIRFNNISDSIRIGTRSVKIFNLINKYNNNIISKEIEDTNNKYDIIRNNFIYGIKDIIIKYIKPYNYDNNKIIKNKVGICDKCDSSKIKIKIYDRYEYRCIMSCTSNHRHWPNTYKFKLKDTDLLYNKETDSLYSYYS